MKASLCLLGLWRRVAKLLDTQSRRMFLEHAHLASVPEGAKAERFAFMGGLLQEMRGRKRKAVVAAEGEPSSKAMASGAPSTPAPVPSTPAPKSELHGKAQESEEEQEEWDMNSPHHSCQILESRFPYDMVKFNVKVSEFTKISMFYIESLKRRECRRHHCLTIS